MSSLPSESKTPISSSNRKSVFLREWWLIKVEGTSRPGIGGYFNRETLGSRGMRLFGSASVGKRSNFNTLENRIQIFLSAAIAKRLDNNTLEAEDGIKITISGCINRSRTLSYGFPPEVCNHFLSGFPCNWEDYASRAETSESWLPISFDDLPVTHVRDILMSTTQESEACAFTSTILKDILKQCGAESLNQNIKKNSTEIERDHKSTEKLIEEGDKINSFPVDLHESPVKLFDPFSNIVDPKSLSRTKHGAKCKTKTDKRRITRSNQRYSLRSTVINKKI